MLNTNTKTDYLKAWVVTTRPKVLILSIVPFIVGTLFAKGTGVLINWSLMFFGSLSALFIQIGTNFINDVYDLKHKADKPTRLGVKRGIQQGVLTPTEVFLAGLTSFAIALLFGIPLVAKEGFFIGLLLLASVCSGFYYTGGKKPLAYNGLGEVFVILFFGIVATVAAFFFQTGFVSLNVLIAGLQLGMLATLPMAINNLRDIKDDALSQKNTLAVKFGKKFARIEIGVLALMPFLLCIGFLSKGFIAFSPCLVLPLGFMIVRSIWKLEPSEVYNIFLGQSVLLYLLFSILLLFIAI